MDRREAVEWLKDIKESGVLADWSYDVALDLAIEALKGDLHCPKCGLDSESATATDCISRKQAIEALTGWETEPLDEDIVRTLNNLPPVTSTVSEDCISRGHIKNMIGTYGKYVWQDENYIDDGYYLDRCGDWAEITAWQPLPEPYKGGDTE